ncbi:MAG: DUF6057 family protein [bacterium]|nr:DUF6057 family protein [bacterium]
MSKKKRHGHSDTLREVPNLPERPTRFPLKAAGFAFGAMLTAAVFFFYAGAVRPELIHFNQQPVFFADPSFLAERLHLPGGFLDFIAAFLTELFRWGWLGSLVLTGLGLTVCLLLFRLMRPGRLWAAAVLPALLLVAAQARADHLVVKTLSLILGLEAFILFRDFAPGHRAARFGLAAAALIPVYWLSPGACLLFAALAVIHAPADSGMKIPARLAFAAGIAAAAAFIPWAAGRWFYLVSERNAFLRHSAFWRTDVFQAEPAPGFPWDAAAVLCVLALTAVFAVVKGAGENGRPRTGRPSLHAAQAAALVPLLLAAGMAAVDRDEREYLAVRLAAREGDWKQVTGRMTGPAAGSPIGLCHINRALWHSGRLGSDFFSLPANFLGTGLFPDRDSRFQAPLDCSDLFNDLGHVNEAKRWAFEALTLHGESADVLKRLAETHLASGQDSAAARFLDRLRLNPFARRWADRRRALLSGSGAGDGESAAAARLRETAGRLPEQDFVVDSRNPVNDMERLAKAAPDNRMAVDYLLMSNLIDRDLRAFTRNLVRFRPNLPDPLPALYEEGLIAALSAARTGDPAAASIPVRRTTLDRFADFERILKAHGIRNAEAAADLGRGHAATYWYYLLYGKRAG